ncbi:unnamed protein product [Cylindrotheca closterium]|uniref:Uncharacterized protein n=1 Tax=Cylindrotheca closterium TaxID=2856 RepID=A0AAD2GBH3_9STRA|nr:unnamed protein product [Cylindrotheca closterium]
MGGFKAMYVGFKIDGSDQQLRDQLGLKYNEEYKEWSWQPVFDENDMEFDPDDDDEDGTDDDDFLQYVDDMEIDFKAEELDTSNIVGGLPPPVVVEQEQPQGNECGDTNDDTTDDHQQADMEGNNTGTVKNDDNNSTVDKTDDADVEEEKNPAVNTETMDDGTDGKNNKNDDNDGKPTSSTTPSSGNYDTKQQHLIKHPDYPFYPYLPVATYEQQESLIHAVGPCCGRTRGFNFVVFGYKIISGEAWAPVDQAYELPNTPVLAQSVIDHWQYLGRHDKTVKDVGLLLFEHACSCS